MSLKYLRLGLRPGKRKGYYGYKWRKPIGRPLSLWVCMTGCSKDMTEAIEAELVRIVRCATGKWPAGQTEIHFHSKPGAAELAAKLHAEVLKKRPRAGGHRPGDAGSRGVR